MLRHVAAPAPALQFLGCHAASIRRVSEEVKEKSCQLLAISFQPKHRG